MSELSPTQDDAVLNQMLRYLDGTLPEPEVAVLNERLKNDMECRETFQDLMLQQIKLKEIAEAVQLAVDTAAEEEQILAEENIVPLPRCELMTSEAIQVTDQPANRERRIERLNQSTRRFRWRSGLALAASLTVLGVIAWLVMLPAKIATVAMADEGILVERGSFQLDATSGMILRVGDRVVTPAGGRMMFSYVSEATEVTVEPGSDLVIELEENSKRLLLDDGAIVADVAKQDPNRPLQLMTPEAEAIVVGTRFKLSTRDRSTKLEVFEGAVRIQQTDSPTSTQVPAGHFVNVQTNQMTALLPIPGNTGLVHLVQASDTVGGATKTILLNQLMFSGVGTTSGSSEIRGYLHPPLSGAYVFQLTANGKVDLKVSDTENPGAAASVVSVANSDSGADNSETVLLQAGRRYYFEMDCESSGQPINFTVSWKMPGGMHRVVYGEYLSPFDAE